MKAAPAAAVVAVAAIALSGVMGAALRARRAARPAPSAAAEGASIALGPFRGILADALWIRAGRLQEKRRFAELIQLADWITALEPENEDVWIFHAWNLAYNISFLVKQPADRWHWVRGGIELLRDRGIPSNPGSSALRRELGWLFQHKLGSDSDTAANFYRTEWAREMDGWLGPGGAAPASESLAAEELSAALRMDASDMAALERRFGPIDWRVPFASSLYWASQALALADEKNDLPCRRMIYVSLAEMVRRGGILSGSPGDPDWAYSATGNPALLEGALSFTRETMARHSFSGVRHAYAGLLFDAIALSLSSGDVASARARHAQLCDFLRECGVEHPPAWEELDEQTPSRIVLLLEAAGW